MEQVVASEEPVARFIFSSSHFSIENKRVKHNAFLPTPARETSVFRITGPGEDQIWNLGKDIASTREQTLHARADLIAADVRKIKLEIEATPEPPRHANIVHWPAEKSAQKQLAMGLASMAYLALP